MRFQLKATLPIHNSLLIIQIPIHQSLGKTGQHFLMNSLRISFMHVLFTSEVIHIPAKPPALPFERAPWGRRNLPVDLLWLYQIVERGACFWVTVGRERARVILNLLRHIILEHAMVVSFYLKIHTWFIKEDHGVVEWIYVSPTSPLLRAGLELLV